MEIRGRSCGVTVNLFIELKLVVETDAVGRICSDLLT